MESDLLFPTLMWLVICKPLAEPPGSPDDPPPPGALHLLSFLWLRVGSACASRVRPGRPCPSSISLANRQQPWVTDWTMRCDETQPSSRFALLSRSAHPTLCDPVDCSPPASPVRGDSSGKCTGAVAMPSSRGSSSRPGDRTHISHIAGRSFTV